MADNIFVICVSIFFAYFLFIAIKAINISLDKAVEKKPVFVEIVSYSNQFSWYAGMILAQNKEEDKWKEEEKRSKQKKEFKRKKFIYEVEPQLTEEGWYKTIEDTSGPGVKGFIVPTDTILINNTNE